MTYSLSVEDLSLDVADGGTTRHLLQDISFEVHGGEVVGVTGPSGSGKSTLLVIAGSLQRPTSGEVTLHTPEGSICLSTPRARTRREHIGIVFQQPNLLPALTAEEQLVLMTRLNRVLPHQRRRAKERANELLAAVGLEGMGGRRIGSLSGGQQARVNLARALMNKPKLLLADEPTAALDTQAATMVTELISTLAHEHKIPTLYVSHDQQQLAKLDRTLTIVDGSLKELASVPMV